MTITFATRLVGEEGLNLRTYVTIEGINEVFQDAESSVPTALLTSTRTRLKCVTEMETDRRELDMVERRAKGGGLRLRLLDDSSNSLRSLFAMRKRRATFIAANASNSATTITVKSTTSSGLFAAAGDFWVGAECISYTSKNATQFLGCTRGAYGTTARALRGGSTNGQAVYDKPPSWIGRKVTLKGYFLEADGTDPTSTDMQATLGTFEIDSPPQYIGDNLWELRAVDRIDNYLKKAIYSGVESKDISAGRLRVYMVFTPGDVQGASVYLTDDAMIGLLGTSTVGADLGDHAFILMDITTSSGETTNDGLTIMRATSIESTTSSDGRHKVFLSPLIDLNRNFDRAFGSGAVGGFPGYELSEARAVVYLREKADKLALKVLTSDDGDGGNGTSDVLLGRDTSAVSDTGVDVFGWRIGANIKEADIDTAALAAVGHSVEWFYFGAEPSTVSAFMRDFCTACDAFVLTTIAGQFSVKSMSDGPSAISSLTIDDDMVIGKAKATYDEANVYPHIVFEYGYDPTTQQFGSRTEIQDSEMMERYPSNDATLTLKDKSVYGHARNINWLSLPITPADEIRRRMRRYQCEEAGRGSLYVDVTVHLDALLLNLGDIVTLTVDDVPDMEGSTVSGRRARVVSHLTDWANGRCDLRLQVLRPPKRISPAAIIDSTASADTVLTLSNDPPETGGVGSFMFGVDNKVRVWDVSGNVSHSTSLVAAGVGTVTLDTAPAWAIAAGDFITLDDASAGDTSETQAGYVPLTDFIFQVHDDEREFEDTYPLVGESRWR